MPGYSCQGCDGGNPVEWLITNLRTGGTIASCAEDMPVAGVSLLAEALDVDAGRLLEAIKRWHDRETARQAKGGPQPAPQPLPKTAEAGADGGEQT